MSTERNDEMAEAYQTVGNDGHEDTLDEKTLRILLNNGLIKGVKEIKSGGGMVSIYECRLQHDGIRTYLGTATTLSAAIKRILVDRHHDRMFNRPISSLATSSQKSAVSSALKDMEFTDHWLTLLRSVPWHELIRGEHAITKDGNGDAMQIPSWAVDRYLQAIESGSIEL